MLARDALAWVGDTGAARDSELATACRLLEARAVFSAGDQVAFAGVQHGPLTDADPRFAPADQEDNEGPAWLHLAGVVRVAGGRITGGRVIRDRLGLMRRLAQTASQARD